jgi:hypothetical protein
MTAREMHIAIRRNSPTVPKASATATIVLNTMTATATPLAEPVSPFRRRRRNRNAPTTSGPSAMVASRIAVA